MSQHKLLKDTSHRPWPLPSWPWKYYQEWNRVLFLHWAVDPELLRPLIPAKLELDEIEGQAWVSLVAFTMEQIRPKLLPAFPPVSNFDEINIRTYVKSGNKTGVYFLSIEAGKRFSAWLARSLSALPYRYSAMKRTADRYEAVNRKFDDRFRVEFNIRESKVEVSETDRWLTERYALFQDKGETIQRFEIHHAEWSIEEVEVHNLEVDYPRFSALLEGSPDRAHYSAGVKVLAWGGEKK